MRQEVLDDTEKAQLRKGMRTIWGIWAAMMASLGMYLILALILGEAEMTSPSIELFQTILYGIAFVELILIHFLRRLMLRGQFKWLTQSTSAITGSPTGYYQTIVTVSLALSESIGIYGLLLFFLSRDLMNLYPFLIISVFVMLVYRPKFDELERLAITMKEAES